MITLKQFTGQTIAPTDDAALYDFFSSRQSGIITGCRVTSLGDNLLQVSAGRGMIRGRSFAIEQEDIRAQLGSGDNQLGRLSIKIDLGNADSPIGFVTVAGGTLADPIQEEINQGGSVYELPLAEYTAGVTQITGLKNVAPQLVMATPVLTEAGEYSGTGEATRIIELGYQPLAVRVFAVGEPPVAVSTLGEAQIYMGVATRSGGSKGLKIVGNGFQVNQSNNNPPDGKKNMLNQSGKRYFYLITREGRLDL